MKDLGLALNIKTSDLMNFTHISGYPSLAAFIANDRDRSTLIFKRFDRLAARNLLHLQSELAQLQARLDQIDLEDATGQEDPQESMKNLQYLRSWDDFTAAAQGPRQKERFELVERIKSVLKEYREALLFESTLACLPRPTKKVLSAFQLEFYNRKRGDPAGGFPTLGGNSSNIYDDRDDLVALKVPEHLDRLTSFTQDHLAFLFETGQRDGRIGNASDAHIARFVVIFSIFLATLLLVGAIISLYIVQSPEKRLAMIATFTIIFAAGVGLLTNARRPELFAATAAYAAVLVVFVSGNLGGGGSNCSSTCPAPNG